MINKIRYFWLMAVVLATSNEAFADSVEKVTDEAKHLSSNASEFLHKASMGTSALVGIVLLFFVAKFIIKSMIKMAFLVFLAGCAYAYLYLDYQTYLKDWFGIVLP